MVKAVQALPSSNSPKIRDVGDGHFQSDCHRSKQKALLVQGFLREEEKKGGKGKSIGV
jgi:hypothetical protein